MLKRITVGNKSIFISWVVAYVSILIIPILISSFVYYKSGKSLEREIIRANESLLNQIQYVMDSNLRELNRLGVELDFNSYVNELINSNLNMEGWRRFSTYQLVKDLRIYDISNDFISDLFIYFKGNDLILSSTSSNESTDYYNIYIKKLGISFDEWKKLINGKYYGNFISVGQNNELLYIKSLPILEPKEAFANLIITINDVFFQQTIRNTKWLEKGEVFVLNKKDEIIFSTSMQHNNVFKYAELTGANGFMRRKIDGKKVIEAYSTSAEADWKYISVIPEEIFWEKAKYVRMLTMISLPLCILLGGLAALFFLKKNYKPISELTHELANRAGVGFSEGTNEYKFIREAMSKTLQEKEQITQILEHQRAYQRSSFLLNILKGRVEGLKYIHESLSFFDINFSSDTFIVILISMNDYSEIFYNSRHLEESEKLELANYVITNVIEEVVSRYNKGYFVDSEGMIACLVNLNKESLETAKLDVLESVSEAQAFIREKFNIDFTAAISNVHSTLFGISEAYQEAVQLMEYKMVMGVEKLVSYDDMPREQGASYQYSLETEQKLINYIRSGEYEYARDVFENTLNTYFQRNKVPAKIIRCFMVDIVNTILRVSGEVQLQFSDVERILESKKLIEMKGEILSVLKKACDNVNSLKQDKNRGNELVEKSMALIKNNYSNDNLNISFIAEKLSISPDYLSRIFKSHTGEAMLDYINKIRLVKAKELLIKEESIIAEVAKETGFTNVNTFIRIFKKYEGVTPGQYKALVL